MQYPKDDLNLFDHTQFDIYINQNDSLTYTIHPIHLTIDQMAQERFELEIEIAVLEELARQDSLNSHDTWDDEVEYYPDFGSEDVDEQDSTSIDYLHQSYDDAIDDYDLHLDLILNTEDTN